MDYASGNGYHDASRRGTIYMTADDSGAPFMDVVDGVAAFGDWNTAGKIRTRPAPIWHCMAGTPDSKYGSLPEWGSLAAGTTDKIVLNPAGDSYFAGVMTIGTAGEIRQGTGTLGSNFTGLRIWRESNVGRISGYNNNVAQWWGATDGKLYGASGALWIDTAGLNLTPYASVFADDQLLSFGKICQSIANIRTTDGGSNSCGVVVEVPSSIQATLGLASASGKLILLGWAPEQLDGRQRRRSLCWRAHRSAAIFTRP
ncbi:MAG: hypothetical protein IPL15_11395 [Comamonadaceae bacterium]|uniref:hypothetical protein n=1 Tax=Candidatus Skiveiella danica TaxID=3386177 RepID=UPI00390A047C|nr:hypothetical protein [Comamonadaceae bacterium]